MRFHLIKNMVTIFSDPNDSLKRKTTPSDILFTPKQAILKDSPSAFTPMLSEKRGSAESDTTEFWSMKVMEKCRTVLMDELDKGSKRLNPSIIITLTSTARNGEFSVEIRDCAMLANIYKVCGANANFMVEINFLGPRGNKTMAGLITHEMRLGQDAPGDRTKISGLDTEIIGTEAMREFWECHTCNYDYNVDRFKPPTITEAKPMSAVCNVILIVDDDWPLFKNIIRSDINRHLLDSGVFSDVEIVTYEGRIKCHRMYLELHSAIFRNMFERDPANYSFQFVLTTILRKAHVIALLKFLYCEELATNGFEMMFELLKISQNLEIAPLERAIVEELCQKQDIYFTAEFAERVFLFVRNLPRADKLKKKMAQILASEGQVPDSNFGEMRCSSRIRMFYMN